MPQQSASPKGSILFVVGLVAIGGWIGHYFSTPEMPAPKQVYVEPVIKGHTDPSVRLETYRRDDQWHWRARGANGEPLASGEAYKNRADMLSTMGLLFGPATVQDVTDDVKKK
jgi:hypothetical protein